MKRDLFVTMERERRRWMTTSSRNQRRPAVLKGVRTNIVQSIRAFRVQDLQDAADARRASTSCMPTWRTRRASRTCWT